MKNYVLLSSAVLAALVYVGCNSGREPELFSTSVRKPPEHHNEPFIQLEDAEILALAETFALGRVGYAYELPAHNQAWGRIIQKETAPQVLRVVFEEGTLAARVYALLGLWLKDRSAFESLLPRLEALEEGVLQSGDCFGSQQSLANFLNGAKNDSSNDSWDAMAQGALKSYQTFLAELNSSEK